ncbi:MAG: hypothetical protein MJZ34_10570 [Paludibacteraceae bacterium]|nr:hypothetical protein [Paludibacteraceae bacterium]
MLKVNNDDGKNLVLVYVCDNSGCSHVRIRYFAEYMNGLNNGLSFVILPCITFDPQLLAHAKCIWFQKPVSDMHLEVVSRYKSLQTKYGYKLVFELDDLFFNCGLDDKYIDGVPDYNPSTLHRNEEAEKHTEELIHKIVPMFDSIVCSTDYLRMVMQKKFNIGTAVTIKNNVPRFLWNFPIRGDISNDLDKPTVLYSGSPTHYINPVPKREPSPQEPNGFPGIEGKKGDWDNAWCDWVIKNVKEDKINFVVMGALPFFFEEIKDKIKFIPWHNSHSYPRFVMQEYADFQIAPLVCNHFNMSKSALRFYESCAVGTVLLGTVFEGNNFSPYEEINNECKVKHTATVEDIDKVFWPLCKKDKFNEIRRWQYNYINQSGLWLESDENINKYLTAMDNMNNNFDIV